MRSASRMTNDIKSLVTKAETRHSFLLKISLTFKLKSIGCFKDSANKELNSNIEASPAVYEFFTPLTENSATEIGFLDKTERLLTALN